jgi:hypothetical protein
VQRCLKELYLANSMTNNLWTSSALFDALQHRSKVLHGLPDGATLQIIWYTCRLLHVSVVEGSHLCKRCSSEPPLGKPMTSARGLAVSAPAVILHPAR